MKKYSQGFETYDFTARIYAPHSIKLTDVEEHEIQKAKKKLMKKKEVSGDSRTITESSNFHGKNGLRHHFTKAGD